MVNLNTPEFWDTEFKIEYDAWKAGQYDKTRFLPIKFLNVTAHFPVGGKILDIGCGLGHFCRYLQAKAPFAYETFGTDFSPFAIHVADQLDSTGSYAVTEPLSYRQPFPDHYFDAVVAMDVIEHLSDVSAFITELDRLTKPGGAIVITTPEKQASGELHSHEHVQEFTANGLANLFRDVCGEHGFVTPLIMVDPSSGYVHIDPTIYYTGTKKV